MPVRVSKEFRWEMGHRLPWHEQCRNVHGHSYRMVVDVDGEPDERGMVVDFGEIACLVRPIVDRLDHSFMVDSTDEPMLGFLREQGLKTTLVPFPSTAENIAAWVADQLSEGLFQSRNVAAFTVTVLETATSSASVSRSR